MHAVPQSQLREGASRRRQRIVPSIAGALDACNLSSLKVMVAERLAPVLGKMAPAWRRTVGVATRLGIPVPVLGASLAYFDSYRSPELPQNLTQAQRDALGAHTYQRRDRPDAGFIHSDWS
ncbi:hypothetical protein [Cystobacter fuscus]|nr:hypothetical protein [Cystobacter fuscus]